MNLRHVGGGQVTLFAATVGDRTDHAGQGRFDVQQRTGNIHQHGIARRLPAKVQASNHVDLIEDDLARLAETEHGQGVGNLLERRQQATQLGHLNTVAAHEQVEAVLDLHQLLAQSADHRTHGVAIRAGQAGPLLIDDIGVRQGVVETVLLLQEADAWRLRRRLGHIEQQVLDQLVGGRLVDAIGPLLEQAFQLFIDLAQQGAYRRAIDYSTAGQALDQTRGDLPQRTERRVFAQRLEATENPRHVTQIGRQILIANHPDQGNLQHLAQLAQQHRQLRGAQLAHGLDRQGRRTHGHVRGKQAGFREQLFAAGGAQVVEQRQHHHRQVAACGLDPVEVDRQLEDGLHQHFQGLALVGHAAVHQRLGQMLHFFGEQGRAVELHHLQSALYLVHIGQAEAHARRVLRSLDVRLQGLARLLQGFRDFAFDPFQGDIVVPIPHSHSTHILGSALSGC
ncbi:hypothetical protein D3C85_412230 [compost metagenome]